MANTQTDNSKTVNQQGVTDKQEQKRGFEQRTGNNSDTIQKDRDQKNYPQPMGSNSQDQSKITNQDSKVINKDDPMRKDPKAQGEINDDEDVDDNSRAEDYKQGQEIDTPVQEPEKTEKKIPTMEK